MIKEVFAKVNNFTLSRHKRQKKKQRPESHVIKPVYLPTTSTLLILVDICEAFPWSFQTHPANALPRVLV